MTNNVKILKLVTGEEVVARVKEGVMLKIFTLDNPMILESIPNHQTGQIAITMIPWMKVAKCEKITISTEYILAEDDPEEEAEKEYLSTVTGLTLQI